MKSLLLGLILLTGCGRPHPQDLTTEILSSADTFDNGMPRLLFINGQRWYVASDRDWDIHLTLGHRMAETQCERNVIAIRTDLIESNKKDSLLHEIFHAGACNQPEKEQYTFYNSTDEESHPGFERAANVIYTVLHDNPELTRYLAGNK